MSACSGTRSLGTASCLLLVFVSLGLFTASSGDAVTLLVRDQGTAHDNALRDKLLASVMEAGWSHEAVVSMADVERETGHSGLWSFKPWIHFLHEQLRTSKRRVAGKQRWFVFLEATTAVDAVALGALLNEYDARESIYLGRALRDEESSILHSYADGPPYPLAHAGFALSGGLLQRLGADLSSRPLGHGLHHPQQIEPVFELAQWVKDLGIGLTDRRESFCIQQRPDCSTWVLQRDWHRATSGLHAKDVVIAVKTVEKFHSSRLQHIQHFWAAQSPSEVLYLSNANYDGVVGATVVDLSPEFGSAVDPKIESTKQGSGHCAKMEALLKYLSRHRPGRRWYVVTDDDTLLNVPRLLKVLNSHNDSQAVYLGERYGWAHREKYPGTNYITTGGGMALSGPALKLLQACSACTCRSPNAPDDMTLGSWFAGLDVEPTHEEGFHQAEPHNYHPDVLASADPAVSFHRFAMRLPGSATEKEKAEVCRQNWRSWVEKHFSPRREHSEL